MYSPTANTRNPAIRRIMADVRELERHPSPRYHAVPLEDNFFEWHFTIRGPSGTDFEGGVYHGRILLPSEYPMKPPNIVFLTRNGRFEVGTKICLSISAHHEESWQPAWGVRTMLEAIISFLPSEGAGAIGALEWSREERQKCARESQAFKCPTCGLAAGLLQPEGGGEGEAEGVPADIAEQIAQLRLQGRTDEAGVAGGGGSSDGGSGKMSAAGGGSSSSPVSFTFSLTAALTGAEGEVTAAAAEPPTAPSSSTILQNPWAQYGEPSAVPSIALQMPSREPSGQSLPPVAEAQSSPADEADTPAVASLSPIALAPAPLASLVAGAVAPAPAPPVIAAAAAPAPVPAPAPAQGPIFTPHQSAALGPEAPRPRCSVVLQSHLACAAGRPPCQPTVSRSGGLSQKDVLR